MDFFHNRARRTRFVTLRYAKNLIQHGPDPDTMESLYCVQDDTGGFGIPARNPVGANCIPRIFSQSSAGEHNSHHPKK